MGAMGWGHIREAATQAHQPAANVLWTWGCHLCRTAHCLLGAHQGFRGTEEMLSGYCIEKATQAGRGMGI